MADLDAIKKRLLEMRERGQSDRHYDVCAGCSEIERLEFCEDCTVNMGAELVSDYLEEHDAEVSKLDGDIRTLLGIIDELRGHGGYKCRMPQS